MFPLGSDWRDSHTDFQTDGEPAAKIKGENWSPGVSFVDHAVPWHFKRSLLHWATLT